VFCDFPSLQILYLHGNLIKDIKEVDKLAKLESLRKLALHGNLMDETKVIYYLRQGGNVFAGFYLSVSKITQKVMDGSF